MQDFIAQNSQTIFPIISLWTVIWKGLSLWKAAKKDSKVWFVLLLILNTVGILDILYIFALSKIDFAKTFSNIKNKFTPKKE